MCCRWWDYVAVLQTVVRLCYCVVGGGGHVAMLWEIVGLCCHV